MRVLIPIDESRFSDLALESVKLRVWSPKDELVVCSVVPGSAQQCYSSEQTRASAQRALQESLQYARAFVERKTAELQAALPGNRVGSEVRIGVVGKTIVDLSIDLDVDLIVLGSHSRQGLAKIALGSVAQSVVADAPCSVEIMRISRSIGEQEPGALGVPPLLAQRRILICYDRSGNAQLALDWLADGQWSPEQEFVVLMVIAPLEAQLAKPNIAHRRELERSRVEILAQAERIVAGATEPLRQNPNIKLLQSEVCEGYAAATILQFAEEWKADVVVLGAYADLPAQDPMLGSVARRVAIDANCSVRILRRKPPLHSHLPSGNPKMSDCSLNH